MIEKKEIKEIKQSIKFFLFHDLEKNVKINSQELFTTKCFFESPNKVFNEAEWILGDSGNLLSSTLKHKLLTDFLKTISSCYYESKDITLFFNDKEIRVVLIFYI